MYLKDFASTEVNIFINFNSKSKFMSEETLIHSDGFVDIFTKYLLLIKKRDIKLFRFLNSHCKGDNVSFLISLFALLLQNPREKVAADFEKYKSILEDSSVDKLLELLDGIYSFWRSYERYG